MYDTDLKLTLYIYREIICDCGGSMTVLMSSIPSYTVHQKFQIPRTEAEHPFM